MRKSLADKIEQYIKALIESSGEGQIEIQRSELAETFCCVPSQVTYVISTRFTREEGYISESRRGGKGYVRIAQSKILLENDLPVERHHLLAFMGDILDSGMIEEKEYRLLLFLIEDVCRSMTPERQSELRRLMMTALKKYISKGK